MISIKTVYIGNENESYIQDDFAIAGVNIISSDENHVGKTIVMQAIMYALGSEARFPPSFKSKEYLFIVDLEVDGRELSILRNRDSFVVLDGETITPIESSGDFGVFWNDHISALPTIIKDGSQTIVGLPLYTQIAFVPQAGRSTARTSTSYFNKDDFKEMVYALKGLDARTLDKKSIANLKNKRSTLNTRREELAKQASSLRKIGTSLAVVSPTANREETTRFIEQLDSLKNSIVGLKNERNHAYTRRAKNETVKKELNSLNREIKVGSVICMNCGSDEIGYKLPGSDYVFDITTSEMRSQILLSVQRKIDTYQKEIEELDLEIRELQNQFNKLADSREITLEDIFAARQDYTDLEAIDREITNISDQIDSIDEQLKEAKTIDKELSEDRAAFNAALLATMNDVRRTINESDSVEDYTDLFTTNNSPYIGSEATEFFLAKTYSLAKHIHHGLPIVIDSFRAEELSTGREERVLPLFIDLPNQVIFSATLKGEEVGKYHGREGISSIEYIGYTQNKLLSTRDNERFLSRVADFGIKLNV